jgi:ABC-type dipeptide/oligopeptide/nickel transport system permease subunit
VTPRRLGRRTPSAVEQAATDSAARRFELDEGRLSGPEEEALELHTPAAAVGSYGMGVRMRRPDVSLGEEAEGPMDLAEREGFVDSPDASASILTATPPVPRWRQMLEVFAQNRLAIASTIVLGVIVLGCYIGPHFYVTNQTNANTIIYATPNLAPSSAHWLGTDFQGWDVLGRIMYAGQYSLSLGLFAGLITIVIGTVYGMAAGFFGGVPDAIMMRFIDAALSIPYLFLLVALVTIFHNTTTFLILVIGLTGWWGNSRIIRGDALVIRDLEYSLAATSMGARRTHVIRRHVFPNSMGNIVTVGTFSVADAILALSALGFIGFGIQQPAVDWGTQMFYGSQQLINGYWWEFYPVAVTFVAVILCINYMGDALRDVFEVRLRQR